MHQKFKTYIGSIDPVIRYRKYTFVGFANILLMPRKEAEYVKIATLYPQIKLLSEYSVIKSPLKIKMVFNTKAICTKAT